MALGYWLDGSRDVARKVEVKAALVAQGPEEENQDPDPEREGTQGRLAKVTFAWWWCPLGPVMVGGQKLTMCLPHCSSSSSP